MDDHKQREGKRESGLKQVAFHIGDISADSTAVAGGSIWARGGSSQMVALSWQGAKKKGNFIESLVENGVRGYNEIGGLV